MSDNKHTYIILKEVDGKFVPIGKTFKGTMEEVNEYLEKLKGDSSYCFAADSGKGEKQ